MFILKNRNLVKTLSVWIFDVFLKKKEKEKKRFSFKCNLSTIIQN